MEERLLLMSTASYKELLQEAQPQVIRDETAHRRALLWIEKLMGRPALSAAERRLVELLSKLVNDYEETQHPTPKIEASRLLRHLMESRELTQAEVAKIAGIGRSTVNDILAGRRAVSVENAFRLSKIFAIEATAFLNRSVESVRR